MHSAANLVFLSLTFPGMLGKLAVAVDDEESFEAESLPSPDVPWLASLAHCKNNVSIISCCCGDSVEMP